MHRIAEALRERHRRIIGRQLIVGGGLIAVGTPVALVGAAAGIEHDYAAVLIAIGDIEFLRRFVDHHVGGAAKLAGGIRAARRAGLADLLQEFSLRRKFQNLMVFLIIAGEPYIARPIDEDAVLALRPVVALARSSPGGQEISLGIKLQHRWRGLAAFGCRRILHRALFVINQRAGAMHKPDMVVRIDCNAGHLTENPVLGQRLRPEWLGLKFRNVIGGSGGRGGQSGNQCPYHSHCNPPVRFARLLRALCSNDLHLRLTRRVDIVNDHPCGIDARDARGCSLSSASIAILACTGDGRWAARLQSGRL